jgi:hypothetical protein
MWDHWLRSKNYEEELGCVLDKYDMEMFVLYDENNETGNCRCPG